jgi:Rod binding domain-containing protein
MDLASITSQLAPNSLTAADSAAAEKNPHDEKEIAKVSKQFEAIMVRQFLSESMKPLLQNGPSGQVYGYMLTDGLANEITNGGGLGLSHIIQSQLSQKHHS